jgi:hypothetical protein
MSPAPLTATAAWNLEPMSRFVKVMMATVEFIETLAFDWAPAADWSDQRSAERVTKGEERER